MALGQNIYNSNYDVLSPYASRGNVAGDAINALLGLPSAPAMHSPLAAAPMAAGGTAPAPSGVNLTQGAINAMLAVTGPQRSATAAGISDPAAKLRYLLANAHPDEQAAYQAYMAANQNAAPPAPAAPPAHTPPIAPPRPAPAGASASPLNALNNFANSAGMKFAQQEGANAVNMGAAGNGWLQSGAALQALQQRGQDIALQQYFPMYTGMLGQQQAVGAGAASSIAGVGQNFANSAANINGQMGNAIGNNAYNQGNLALQQGNVNANMWNQLGSSFGSVLGGLPQNSYGRVSGSGGL
jgi:hypothetical protein